MQQNNSNFIWLIIIIYMLLCYKGDFQNNNRQNNFNNRFII